MKSKRIWTLILTSAIAPLLIQLGVPQDTVTWLIGLALTAIAGETIRPHGAPAVGRGPG